jgi:AraC-like DNA-binding protein
MEELADQVVPDAQLENGALARDFMGRQDPAQPCISRLDRALLELRRTVTPRDARALVISRQCTAASVTSVGSLAEALGVSRQHLAREVKRATGLGPKDLLRSARLQRVVATLSRGQRPDAGFALDAGYGDQSHFINDFHGLAGVTPYRYVKERSVSSGSISPRQPGAS